VRLSIRAKAALDEIDCTIYLSAIVLAEACWIVEHNRTSIPSAQDLLAAIDRDPRFVLVPVDRHVVELTTRLRSVGEMHDRQIVATAVSLAAQGVKVAILTKDADISASGAVPVIW